MEYTFGEHFFPMLTFPFGVYDENTIRAAQVLNFKGICSHYNHRISRRLFYKVGHLMKKGRLFGKNVSNHLKYYPGTKLLQIDTAIALIKKYYDDSKGECEMLSEGQVSHSFNKLSKLTPVVIILIHHRFHRTSSELLLVENIAKRLI